jgi:5-methylcytosine-specific restriction protein A
VVLGTTARENQREVMSRATKEWIGKTDDTPVPTYVADRIYTRCDDKCRECGIPIGPRMRGDIDHVVAICNGGENRESNLQLLCLPHHKEKTKRDVAAKAVAYRVRVKHRGLIKRPRRKIVSRGFDKAEPQHTATRPIIRNGER